MTDCAERLRRLTHPQEIVLDEDLAALTRIADDVRTERYEALKAAEEEFVWEFNYDCPDFLTGSERDRVRSRFRVARLKLAASFYREGSMPAALASDFIEDELQLVVDFERYKRFDALTEEQIQRSIRRMEGEVYELVTQYHTTQLADMDAMLDNPDIQQDVLSELVSLYEERLERIRQGVFIYVGTHGLKHMVESIEEAVRAVTNATAERERVRGQVEDALGALPEFVGPELQTQQRTVEARLQGVGRRPATDAERQGELEAVLRQDAALARRQEAAREALAEQVDRLTALETRLEESMAALDRVDAAADGADTGRSESGDAATLVAEELRRLGEQRERLAVEREQLERERLAVESVRSRLDERRRALDGRPAGADGSPERDATDQGSRVEVTPDAARLLEMNFIGHVDAAMYETSVVGTPDGPFEVPPNYWDGRSEYRSEEGRLEALLGGREPLDTYPVNQRVRYEITKRRLFGDRSTEMIIEAMVLSHLEALVFNGVDETPATLDDLLSVVNEVVFDSEVEQTHHLVVIASPTGWDESVTDPATERGPQLRFSRYVSVLLVDLQHETVVFDPDDGVARQNARLFESPRTDEAGGHDPGETSVLHLESTPVTSEESEESEEWRPRDPSVDHDPA